MKIRFLTIILMGFLTSCFGGHNESPVIYISNASPAPINDIKVVWVDNKVLKLATLNPGQTRSQSFYLDDTDDFFGLVRISWTDANRNKNSRELFFRRNNLPSIDEHDMYSYVQLYFEQNDLEMLSSDNPDMGNITRKRDAMLLNFKNHYWGDKPRTNSSLISVEPLTDRESVPSWTTRAF